MKTKLLLFNDAYSKIRALNKSENNVFDTLMKKMGYPGHLAGGVEAASSAGGQITPPIMGAVAFIMAELIGQPYYVVAVAAALPLIQTPRFVEVHRIGTFPARSLDVDVVFDVMIHDLDIILTAIGSDVVSIEAVGVPVVTDRVDIANARLRFASGCIANLTASRISREQVRKLRFFQQDSYVSVDCVQQEVESWRVTRHAGAPPEIIGGQLKVPRGEPLKLELADFVHSVASDEAPRVGGADGRQALAVAQRVVDAMARTDGKQGTEEL